MNKLGFNKVIIETSEKSELFGLVTINEHEGTARLDYFNKGILIEDFDHHGTREWANEIIVLAEIECKKLNAKLITY